MQFTELGSLGYRGFAIAFCEGKMQLVGTESVIGSFSPSVLEYIHALIQSGKIHMVARFGEKFGRKNSCCVLGQGAGFDDVFIECMCSIL